MASSDVVVLAPPLPTCTITSLPTPTDISFNDVNGTITNIQEKNPVWKNYKKFLQNMEMYCDPSSKTFNDASCNAIAINISDCSNQFNTATNTLNESIISLETSNKNLRAQYLDSTHNTRISNTFFRIYKENAAISYVQNILLILGIFYLLFRIIQIFSKTTEFKMITETINPNTVVK
jgi:hypothetical protein